MIFTNSLWITFQKGDDHQLTVKILSFIKINEIII
jgi:hypothetical protein